MKNPFIFLINTTIDGFNYTLDFSVWCIDRYMKFIDTLYDQYHN